MKYSVVCDINLPRDKVIELFDNPDNLPKWMDRLAKFERLSGNGEPGSK